MPQCNSIKCGLELSITGYSLDKLAGFPRSIPFNSMLVYNDSCSSYRFIRSELSETHIKAESQGKDKIPARVLVALAYRSVHRKMLQSA